MRTADVLGWLWERAQRAGTITPGSRRAARFARFGKGSSITFPPAVLLAPERISLGEDTMIGPDATLSAGMLTPLDGATNVVITVGDRCTMGRGLTIIAHDRVEIGDDTFTGHSVYITDQNHGYEDVTTPIGRQMWRNAPVSIGRGCWLGHASTILPGTTLGRHVVVAAGAVVTGDVPDYSVVAGVPARVIRRYFPERGWMRTDGTGEPLTGQP